MTAYAKGEKPRNLDAAIGGGVLGRSLTDEEWVALFFLRSRAIHRSGLAVAAGYSAARGQPPERWFESITDTSQQATFAKADYQLARRGE